MMMKNIPVPKIIRMCRTAEQLSLSQTRSNVIHFVKSLRCCLFISKFLKQIY